jgi:tellurite resistance protein TehA-like permease
MATVTAYLISLGIIGFGLWICAEAPAASASAGIVIGLVPIAVGSASLANELQNDLHS